jgi:hypothetical protein
MFQQSVSNGLLSVVDVCNYTEIPDMVHGDNLSFSVMHRYDKYVFMQNMILQKYEEKIKFTKVQDDIS